MRFGMMPKDFSMSYEIVGGKVIGIDAQKGVVYNDINEILEHA